MEVKYKRNITFMEVRKIVECYMKENIYTNVAQTASPIICAIGSMLHFFFTFQTQEIVLPDSVFSFLLYCLNFLFCWILQNK